MGLSLSKNDLSPSPPFPRLEAQTPRLVFGDRRRAQLCSGFRGWRSGRGCTDDRTFAGTVVSHQYLVEPVSVCQHGRRQPKLSRVNSRGEISPPVSERTNQITSTGECRPRVSWPIRQLDNGLQPPFGMLRATCSGLHAAAVDRCRTPSLFPAQ